MPCLVSLEVQTITLCVTVRYQNDAFTHFGFPCIQCLLGLTCLVEREWHEHMQVQTSTKNKVHKAEKNADVVSYVAVMVVQKSNIAVNTELILQLS